MKNKVLVFGAHSQSTKHVAAARKVSPNWSQETITFHSSNSIVWSQGNAPLWRAASLSDRNMGENLSPIWPGSHCLNSAKHRPLTAWNHTWGEMRISFRDLLLKLYSTYLSMDHFSRHYRNNKAELMRRTQLKKRTWWNKNHSETAHHSENLWRCRGVLHKLSNRGYLRINMHLFTTNERSAAI